MPLENEELKVVFDGIWSGCIGSATIFQCLFNALKLQPGIDAETLTSDLKDQLERYAHLLPQPSIGQQLVSLASSLIAPEEGT